MNLQKSVDVSCAMQGKRKQDLAASLKITRTWLYVKLKDNDPKYISKIADFFDITVGELINRGIVK